MAQGREKKGTIQEERTQGVGRERMEGINERNEG